MCLGAVCVSKLHVGGVVLALCERGASILGKCYQPNMSAELSSNMNVELAVVRISGTDTKGRRDRARWVIWSSIKVHLVDALAAEGDEGRCSLRYASGSRQTDFDPGISEWGNPLLFFY